jgi:hypothetical protein
MHKLLRRRRTASARGRGLVTSAPRWAKAVAIITVVLVHFVVITLLVGAGHGLGLPTHR